MAAHDRTVAEIEFARMANFRALDRHEQADVIRSMAATGCGDYYIAAATKLAVEQVRHIIAERAP